MAYVTVSNWTYDDSLNEAALIETAKEKLNQLKAMGATNGYLVRVSPSEGLIVMVYPDEGSWNRVRESVQHMRKDTSPAEGGVFTGAMSGPAIVSV
ncbi:hypothetical protein AVO45_18225 [Ruegeria marisrubri]|uniref:Uncharacterized protein n=1 Tax=Ruegeria marisrubri TaxID=1685379 RepID=A0A0X3U7Q1_9RHOB|nr:hypothetical protein [Ruegeria marisrubri]KUJ84117.1 hypothetical protein AVO45_18225 [Ruegeria marisrubri]